MRLVLGKTKQLHCPSVRAACGFANHSCLFIIESIPCGVRSFDVTHSFPEMASSGHTHMRAVIAREHVEAQILECIWWAGMPGAHSEVFCGG